MPFIVTSHETYRDADIMAFYIPEGSLLTVLPVVTNTCWECQLPVNLGDAASYTVSRICGDSRHGYEPCHKDHPQLTADYPANTPLVCDDCGDPITIVNLGQFERHDWEEMGCDCIVGATCTDCYEPPKWLVKARELADDPGPVVVPLPDEPQRPAFMDQCRYPATYHGSKVNHHGDVMVTLDWDAIDKYGDTRYVVFCDGGKIITQVREQSLTFPA